MLDSPSGIHAHRLPSRYCLRLQQSDSELCKVSSELKHHAGGCKGLSANSRLFLSLSAPLLPQELAAQCFCSLSFSLSLAHSRKIPVSRETKKKGAHLPPFSLPPLPDVVLFHPHGVSQGGASANNNPRSIVTSQPCM